LCRYKHPFRPSIVEMRAYKGTDGRTDAQTIMRSPLLVGCRHTKIPVEPQRSITHQNTVHRYASATDEPMNEQTDRRTLPSRKVTNLRRPLNRIFTARCYLCIVRTMLPEDAVCPSVCLSVTRRYSVETAKSILKLISPSGSHTTDVLVFPYQTGWQ